MNSTSFRMVAVEASVEVPAEGYKQSLLSQNGKSRAWSLARLPDGGHALLGEERKVGRRVHLRRSGDKTDAALGTPGWN
jgi:hypothetical protein